MHEECSGVAYFKLSIPSPDSTTLLCGGAFGGKNFQFLHRIPHESPARRTFSVNWEGFQFLHRIPPRGKRMKFIEATKIFQFLHRIPPTQICHTSPLLHINFQFLHRIPPETEDIRAKVKAVVTFQFLHRIPHSNYLTTKTIVYKLLSIPSPDSTVPYQVGQGR